MNIEFNGSRLLTRKCDMNCFFFHNDHTIQPKKGFVNPIVLEFSQLTHILSWVM